MSEEHQAKRARVTDAVALYDSKDKQIVVADSGAPARTSDLHAPTMLLTGHGASTLRNRKAVTYYVVIT